MSGPLGLWHCFGCGEGGDVISFVQKIDQLSFTEAVEHLANRAGIQLRYEEAAGPVGPGWSRVAGSGWSRRTASRRSTTWSSSKSPRRWRRARSCRSGASTVRIGHVRRRLRAEGVEVVSSTCEGEDSTEPS